MGEGGEGHCKRDEGEQQACGAEMHVDERGGRASGRE
jgi:hypothetical protein